MAELESIREKLINAIKKRIVDKRGNRYYCNNILVIMIDSNEPIDIYLNKQTDIYLVELAKKIKECGLGQFSDLNSMTETICNLSAELKTNMQIYDIRKELANINNYTQNAADIVNLFTDIDKNRTNLEEQNKEINKKLDKLEESTNERFQKLENLIMLVLNKIEKS